MGTLYVIKDIISSFKRFQLKRNRTTLKYSSRDKKRTNVTIFRGYISMAASAEPV